MEKRVYSMSLDKDLLDLLPVSPHVLNADTFINESNIYIKRMLPDTKVWIRNFTNITLETTTISLGKAKYGSKEYQKIWRDNQNLEIMSAIETHVLAGVIAKSLERIEDVKQSLDFFANYANGNLLFESKKPYIAEDKYLIAFVYNFT